LEYSINEKIYQETKIFEEWQKINQTKAMELKPKDGPNLSLKWAILVIIIYLPKQLFILEENPNSISFDQSHNIKENKKKVFNWYNKKKKLVY